MLRAKDIMIEDVISVRKDTPIYDALELLAENRIAGVPVVEEDMTLIGILSEKDVLSLLFYATGDEEEKTVNDFMTKLAIYFDESENLLGVCNFLAKNIFRRVPITSNGKLVGIISRGDIIAHIVKAKKSVGQELSP